VKRMFIAGCCVVILLGGLWELALREMRDGE
jgi:hypothetical protein